MFFKEECYGTIKARGCVDGCKQRENYNNADATSPTVSTEAVPIFAVINSYEERDVAVVDIQGAHISADLYDDVFMIVRGTMAELIVAADPKLYRKYISYRKKGEALLYVRVQKSLYRCIKSALPFKREIGRRPRGTWVRDKPL